MSVKMRALLQTAALVVISGCQASPPPPAAAPPELEGEAANDLGDPSSEAAIPKAPKPDPEPKPEPSAPQPTDPRLLQPAQATLTAPERFTVLLATTAGDLHIDVRRSWAPLGADRFYNLVKVGFLDDVAFFRVVGGFVAQAGLHGDPAVNAAWRSARIDDDPVAQSNVPGMVAYAAAGRNTRTTQFFINLGSNANLDGMGFAPFGRVRELEIAKRLFSGYGEGAPGGAGPAQQRIQREGNRYLRAEFPKLDYIKRATIEGETRAPVKQRALPLAPTR